MKRVLALLLIAALLLTGCDSASPAPVTITVIHGWGTMEPDAVAMRSIYQDFEKAYPNVTVNLISMPSTDQVLSKVGDLLSVGDVPDVIFLAGMGGTLLDFMIENRYALDLAPYIEADEAFAANIAPAAVARWTDAAGSTYTLPDVLWQYGLWVNEALLSEAGISEMPRTWDAFFDACDRIAAWAQVHGNGVVPVQIVANDVPILLKFIMAGESEDGLTIVESEQMDYDAPAFEQAVEKLNRLAAYSPESTMTYEYRDSLSVFNQGGSVFYINGIWANSMIDSGIDAVCAAFPGASGETVALETAMSGYVLGNTGDTARMDVSAAFLKYMLSDEVQTRILTETGQYPANPTVDLTEYATAMPRLFQGVEAIRSADIRLNCLPDTYGETERAALIRGVGSTINGDMTASELARVMASQYGQ